MSTTTPVAEKWTRIFPIALLVLAIGLALSYMLISPHPITSSSAPASSSESASSRLGSRRRTLHRYG